MSLPGVICTRRYWHSHFLQVRYPVMASMDNTAQTSSGIPVDAVYGPADRDRRPAAPRASSRSPAATSRPATVAGSGRSGSTPASAPPRSPTAATATCSSRAAPGLSVALGSAHPVRVRLRRRRVRRGGRPRRRRGGHPGRRRDPVRRHPAGQDQHQLHHQRHRRDHAGVLRRRRREGRRAKGEADRHHPERHPQGVRVARHLDLAAGAVAATDRRHHRVLCGRGAPVQRDLGGRCALPRRRCQCRAGDGLHPGRRCHLLRHRRRAGPDDHRPVRPADLVLLLHPRRLLRGDREIPCGTAPLGHHRA